MKKAVIIEKDCDEKIHVCNKINFSSNINEVIKAVLNFLFFYEKIWHTLKAQKASKASKALKRTKTLGQKHKTQISK